MELKGSYLPFVVLLWTALAVDRAKGYPTGASNDSNTCTTLFPGHGVPAQTTEMPYDVIVDGIPSNGSHDATINHTGKPYL